MNIHELKHLGRAHELTDTQRETLTMIAKETRAKGVPPTIRELCGYLNVGSTNGMKVNGRRVASTRLSPGDQVTVGTTTFLFDIEQ